MTLTTYQNLIETVGLSKIDAANKEMYNIVKEGSDNFTDPDLWKEMLVDADIKEGYDLHVKALEKMSDGEKPAKETPKQKEKRKAKNKETRDVIYLYKKDEPVATKKVVAKKPKLARETKKTPPRVERKKRSKATAVSSSKKATPKKSMKAAKPKVIFPVTVKKLSKELQLIKRMANMHNKRKSVLAISSLQRDLSKTLKSNPDRKSVLSEMNKRLNAALASAKTAGVKDLDIKLEKSFHDQLKAAIKSPRPKMQVQYLAGAPESVGK